MKLFLSHASEDKAFVRELAKALDAAGLEVWLDEKEITIGDSLQGRINAGLLECDYAVVVISQTFCGKKWTQAELDGLMALETTTRKMILPVLKDITIEEVAKQMPMMAGRLGAMASDGVDAVVRSIKAAVGIAERQRDLSKLDKIRDRFQRMSSSAKARKTADALLWSSEGAGQVRGEFRTLTNKLEQYVLSISTEELPFTFKLVQEDTAVVHASHRLGVEVHYVDGSFNSASEVKLRCTFYQLGKMKHFGERDNPRVLSEHCYSPYFDAQSAVVWSNSPKRETFQSTEDLISTIAEKLAEYIEREVKSHS